MTWCRERHHIYAGVAELADALDLGSSGRPWGFKSLHPYFKRHLKRDAFFVWNGSYFIFLPFKYTATTFNS